MEPFEKLSGSVLVVDDEEGIRTAHGRWLARRVEAFWLAPNGAAGLELFEMHRPDVVVTDLAMPVMDGLSMIREIKAAAPTAQIIVTTGYSTTQHFLDSIDAGVDGYVLKPIEYTRLFAVLRKAMSIVATARALAQQQVERERLLRELQESTSRVKVLSGLLPICASCKMIRDDAGYWKQLETYITEHSGVLFSHGFCPGCVRQLYPDLADRALSKSEHGHAGPPKSK